MGDACKPLRKNDRGYRLCHALQDKGIDLKEKLPVVRFQKGGPSVERITGSLLQRVYYQSVKNWMNLTDRDKALLPVPMPADCIGREVRPNIELAVRSLKRYWDDKGKGITAPQVVQALTTFLDKPSDLAGLGIPAVTIDHFSASCDTVVKFGFSSPQERLYLLIGILSAIGIEAFPVYIHHPEDALAPPKEVAIGVVDRNQHLQWLDVTDGQVFNLQGQQVFVGNLLDGLAVALYEGISVTNDPVEKEKNLAQMQLARSIAPHNPWILRGAAFCHQALGQNKTANHLFTAVLKDWPQDSSSITHRQALSSP